MPNLISLESFNGIPVDRDLREAVMIDTYAQYYFATPQTIQRFIRKGTISCLIKGFGNGASLLNWRASMQSSPCQWCQQLSLLNISEINNTFPKNCPMCNTQIVCPPENDLRLDWNRIHLQWNKKRSDSLLFLTLCQKVTDEYNNAQNIRRQWNSSNKCSSVVSNLAKRHITIISTFGCRQNKKCNSSAHIFSKWNTLSLPISAANTKRNEVASSIVIQQYVRRAIARHIFCNIKNDIERNFDACVKIQKIYRKFCSRKKLDRIKKKKFLYSDKELDHVLNETDKILSSIFEKNDTSSIWYPKSPSCNIEKMKLDDVTIIDPHDHNFPLVKDKLSLIGLEIGTNKNKGSSELNTLMSEWGVGDVQVIKVSFQTFSISKDKLDVGYRSS